jgi:dienelactone hydrolase
MGGSAALYAIDRDLAAQYFGQRFRAAIAYYPSCVVVPVPAMIAPVLILIGEADQWNRADACKTLKNLARPDGAPIDLALYPVVHHAFDVDQPGSNWALVRVGRDSGQITETSRFLIAEVPLSTQVGWVVDVRFRIQSCLRGTIFPCRSSANTGSRQIYSTGS